MDLQIESRSALKVAWGSPKRNAMKRYFHFFENFWPWVHKEEAKKKESELLYIEGEGRGKDGQKTLPFSLIFPFSKVLI